MVVTKAATISAQRSQLRRIHHRALATTSFGDGGDPEVRIMVKAVGMKYPYVITRSINVSTVASSQAELRPDIASCQAGFMLSTVNNVSGTMLT
mmetsp:Transcript_34/g.120  ORF Transcript_34/g.120 Transcript_34/m.120 type:complete len:94 (+) Transcript_34:1850-2131(+)